MEEIERLRAENKKLRDALKFCGEIASEEHSFTDQNSGSECALRHIIRKAEEVLCG